MSDPPPQCLVWLPLMHRLANVENGETADGIFMGGGGGVELQRAQEDAKFTLVSPYPELANTRSDQRDIRETRWVVMPTVERPSPVTC